jgi:protein transport protein SEC61 subunit alpha
MSVLNTTRSIHCRYFGNPSYEKIIKEFPPFFAQQFADGITNRILNLSKGSTMAGRFLRLFSPFHRITMEVKQPDREVTFKDKMIYTIVVLIIYIVMSVTPIYGVDISQGTDYFYWLRVILASQRGTLTELGIGPIVTAGLIMQLLMGSKLIEVNMSDPADRALFTGAQKVLAILLTIFQGLAYIYGGAFGEIESAGAKILIFIQLLAAGQIIILLDEVLQKGWGLGSGVSLFIAAGVAGQIFWNSFSWIPITGTGTDGLPRGILISFFYVLFTDRTSPIDGSKLDVWDLIIRPENAPGILGFITTIIIFFMVIYVESMRVEIPLTYAGFKGYKGKYPMKLLYVSNIPVILVQALYANLLFFGQLIAGPNSNLRASGNNTWWLNLIGVFEAQEGQTSGYLQPTSGLIYYLTPPRGLYYLIYEPNNMMWIQLILYSTIFIVLCVGFGRIWIEVSGLAPRDIAQQILNSKMQIPGFRRSEKVIEKILKRYIPTLTALCGIIVGVFSVLADTLGSLSSGTGLLLCVGIIQNYAETISKEVAAEQYPAMRSLLGLS